MLTENTTFLLFCVECIHNTGKANTSVCLDIKQTFSYYVANVPWWLRLGWAFVKYHFWLWWSILLKEELDIPKKTIDLPQFTDKLELYGVHLVTGNNQTHNLMVMADANSIRMRSWRQCLLLIKIIYVRNVLSVKAW